jgi:hypothetical protein
VRIRIVQTPLIASVDGVRLDWFRAGLTYEVGSTLGAYLLAEGWAEPADDLVSSLPSPIADFDVDVDPINPPNLSRELFPPYYDDPPAFAPDRRRRRRK